MDPMTPKTRSVRVDSLMNSSPIPTVHKTLTLPDLCDDVLLLICNLLKHHHHQQTPWKHLSLTNRRLYHLLTPQLFNTIRITAPLKALDPNTLTPHLHHHVRTLKIDMFGSLWWWCSGAYVSSSDAIDLFTFMRSLLRLERLEVRMMSRSLDIFSTAFTECSSSLSPELFALRGVKTLTVNSSAAFLVTHCPDLETLVLKGKGDGEDCAMEKYTDLESLFETMPPPSLQNDQDSLFKCAEGLRSFDGSASWSLPELTFLTITFPRLHHLVLRSESYCYRADVASMMHVLGPCLRQLKTLQISKIEYLDMGYRGLWKRAVMECKTEEARRALWEDNEKRRVVAENEVARLAFGSLGALEELWVGEQRVARRSQQMNEGVRQSWIWDRKADTVGDYAVVGTMWAKYQKEREDVIERSELGM